MMAISDPTITPTFAKITKYHMSVQIASLAIKHKFDRTVNNVLVILLLEIVDI